MANEFAQEDKEDLIERGFNNDQIEELESFDRDKDGLYFDICKMMDDFGDTPEEIMAAFETEANNPPPPPPPAQGGKRRRIRKSRKSRRSRRSRKSRKSRRSRKIRR
jgi:hypothetical protein